MNSFTYHTTSNNLNYYSIPCFDSTGLVKTCYTGRLGGVSVDNYSSLNLGSKTDDNKENILENYNRICKVLDIPMENLVCSDQVHGDNIKVVSRDDTGRLFTDRNDIKNVDGLITKDKNVALVTIYADCVPIYLLDPVKKVIALVHGGWRGTASRIASKAIRMMKDEFDTDPEDCLAAIGPSIGMCCYEVDKVVVEKFKNNFTNLDQFVYSKAKNKFMIDLWEANKTDIKEIGVLESNIICSDICTMCNRDILFSHRGDLGKTGRMAAILQLI